jgi:hypothetical protein
MVKWQVTYETDDGKSFQTPEEAEKHSKLISLQKDYETARDRFGIEMLRKQTTADGESFQIAPGPTYYLLLKHLHCPPRIVEVHFYWTHWDWFLDEQDQLKLRVIVPSIFAGEKSRETSMEVYVHELFAKADNARAAWLEADAERLKTEQERHDEAAKNPQNIPVIY